MVRGGEFRFGPKCVRRQEGASYAGQWPILSWAALGQVDERVEPGTPGGGQGGCSSSPFMPLSLCFPLGGLSEVSVR